MRLGKDVIDMKKVMSQGEQGNKMARKITKPRSIKELVKKYVWCEADIAQGKWIHKDACKHRQNKSPNTCFPLCEYYETKTKVINDDKREQLAKENLSEQMEIAGYLEDLENSPESFTRSIKKEDHANVHK